MFYQLFKLSLLSKQFLIEIYGTSSQNALQLENISLNYSQCFTFLLVYIMLLSLSVSCHGDQIITDLTFVDPHHGWE